MASKSASVGQIGSRVAYAGRVIDVNLDRVRFPDGSEGELEMIRHPGAAAVLPLYRAGEWSGGTGPGVVLLRQYRYAADGDVWEVPAGKLAPGEAPEHCARRELEEEAGLQAREMRRLTGIFTTPGFTDEVIHLFLALGLVPGQMAHEDSEFIECRTVALSESLGMIRDGRISDSKTICTLLFAASFEPELDGPLHGR